ncbi:MAG: undecaprenyl-diphosphate phosphatase [Candidatus Pacebacteria bacterium]|nr:undecaprenyl-diphosphate phosphatase [Candidatus Paceibacterota bacterium]
MNILQTIILAITQGVTEFLPISSSGHLAVLQILWNLPKTSIAFNTLLHFGTLGAILAVFSQEIKEIFHNRNWQLIKLIIIGTIPAAIFGFFFQTKIESSFFSLKFIGLSFLITALFLLSTKYSKAQKDTISWLDALIIGIAQAAALFPGISRSGFTISAGLLRKLKPEIAYRFSFLLALPIILGAVILQLPALLQQGENSYLLGGIGMLISFFIGIISLKILEKILKRGKYFWFSLYLIILSMVILIEVC